MGVYKDKSGDPLFIFGAVAVGMFGLPWLGPKLAVAHYIAALVVGLIFRFYGRGEARARRSEPRQRGRVLARAVERLLDARREDGRPLGRLMGDAVNDSIRTLLMICGFIMVFSVMAKMMEVVHLTAMLSVPLATVFRLLGLETALMPSVLAGFLEIDLGTVAASQAQAPLVQQALIASAIIAWSGLSVHGQVASVLSGTDIRIGPYMLARVLHAVIAALVTIPLVRGVASPVPAAVVFGPLAGGPGFIGHLTHAAAWSLGIPAMLTAIGIMAALLCGGARFIGFYLRRT